MVGVISTDGGAHPADKWAAMTANQVVAMVQIDETSASPAAVAARKAKPRLQLAIADAIEPIYVGVLSFERAALTKNGDARLFAPVHPQVHGNLTDEVTEAVAAIQGLTDATPFAAHFRSDAG